MEFAKNELNDAYLSGILDGEGGISILRGSHKETEKRILYEKYTLRLCVTNTDIKLLEWIKEHYAGHIHERKEVTTRWHKIWMWYCGGRKAAEILRICLPYLVSKKERAILVIAFQRTFKGKRTAYRISPDILAIRERIYHQIKAMNGRSGYRINDSKEFPRRLKAFGQESI